ncbi:MAG TPA: CPBP family glutamic-type intramembrane protease [Thermoanaerobaculia bacterium]|nr:CPBP family glutamic-type intramembrane protease [Thermoanaerobaculia bacterium]
MAAVDHFFFAGASVERIRLLGSLPFAQRLLIVAFSAVAEELIYRLFIATAVAAVLFILLRRSGSHAAIVSIWLGILTAALLFGLSHVGNLPNIPHPYLRAIVLNGFAGLVLGALYWYRGLEAAVIAHLAADATIYLVIASLL